ncbi:MAG: MFS transporter, partial [Thermoleophilia bacterium]|nr:MFS transporter [Thermoleophilia bacterium]
LLVSTFSFNFDVLLPLVARRTLGEGAEVFGLIAAVFGAGALCGALILATVARARLLLVLGGAAGFGFFQLLLAPQSSLVVVCVLLFAIGIFYVLWGSSALATLQLAAPEQLRGRAASLYFFAFQGGAPLGGLIAGSLTEIGGTRLAFVSAGTIAIAVAVAGAAALVRSGRPPRELVVLSPSSGRLRRRRSAGRTPPGTRPP